MQRQRLVQPTCRGWANPRSSVSAHKAARCPQRSAPAQREAAGVAQQSAGPGHEQCGFHAIYLVRMMRGAQRARDGLRTHT
jgi:hypothetical protein